MNAYVAGQVPYLSHKMNTIPVYDKNYNFSLSLQSEQSHSCTLYSNELGRYVLES